MDMNKKRFRNRIGVLLMLMSSIPLVWTVWPIKSETRDILFDPGELIVNSPAVEVPTSEYTEGDVGMPIAFQDSRRVILEWTPIVRKGDRSTIKLNFIRNNENIQGGIPAKVNSFKDIYNEYTVNAEARIELPGFEQTPSGLTGQVLPEDQDLVFHWEIIPNLDGIYNGNAWLYLQLFPLLEGDYIEQAVSAQAFQIKVVSILGLNSNIWRVISVLGMIIGIFLQNGRITWIFSRAQFTKIRE